MNPDKIAADLSIFGESITKNIFLDTWPNMKPSTKNLTLQMILAPSEELFNKEQTYLKSLRVGTMFYRENKSSNSHMNGMDFYVGKRTGENKRNPQNYQVAIKNILKRQSNLYAFGNSFKYYKEKKNVDN